MNITGYFELPVRDNDEPLTLYAANTFTSDTLTHSWYTYPISRSGETYNRNRVSFDASKGWAGEK